MTRFTIFTATILLTFTMGLAPGASAKSGDESPGRIQAENLVLEECGQEGDKSVGCLRWTVVAGEQVSFIVRFEPLQGVGEEKIWEGSIESGEPVFDIAHDGPEWLASELAAESGGVLVKLTLYDHVGNFSDPKWLQICVVPEEHGGCPHETDQGVAAWGDVDTIDVEWTTYDEDGPEIAGEPTLDPDEGLAAWGEINAIDVEWKDGE